MVSFKFSNQTWNDNIRKVYYIVKPYTKNNLVAGVLDLLKNYGGRKCFTINHQSFKSYSRGYNIGCPWLEMNHWFVEKKNVYVPHAAVIIRGNVVVGHNPKNICGLYWKLSFLPNKSVRARVLGKGVSRGAVHGLEIPACFVFQGHVKWVEWIKKSDKVEKKVQACFEKCMKTAV